MPASTAPPAGTSRRSDPGAAAPLPPAPPRQPQPAGRKDRPMSNRARYHTAGRPPLPERLRRSPPRGRPHHRRRGVGRPGRDRAGLDPRRARAPPAPAPAQRQRHRRRGRLQHLRLPCPHRPPARRRRGRRCTPPTRPAPTSPCLPNSSRPARSPSEVISGADVDLHALPMLKHFDTDRAKYITSGIIIGEHPETGAGNLSYHRAMIHSRNALATSLHSRGHLWRLLEHGQGRRPADARRDGDRRPSALHDRRLRPPCLRRGRARRRRRPDGRALAGCPHAEIRHPRAGPCRDRARRRPRPRGPCRGRAVRRVHRLFLRPLDQQPLHRRDHHAAAAIRSSSASPAAIPPST